MISYIKGPLVATEEDVIVVEAGHMDLAIHVPVPLLPGFSGTGEGVTVYTYFQVRKGAMTLYGFLHSQDRNMLRQLLGVNGIRPKDALGILSMLQPSDLRLAIVSEDVKALAKAPSIGNKTTRHLILDLKDRISMDDVLGNTAGGVDMDAVDTGAPVARLVEVAKEAVRALVTLDHANTEASRAVKQMGVTDGMTPEDVLRVSLKHLSFL